MCMKLFIDTSSNKKAVVKLGTQVLTKESTLWKSQLVLPMITQLLKLQGATLQNISEIEVVTKGDSFTGLRVGCAIANALGYALNIPVNGKRPNKLKIVAPEY